MSDTTDRSTDEFAVGANETDGVYCPACTALGIDDVNELDEGYRVAVAYDSITPTDDAVETVDHDTARESWLEAMRLTHHRAILNTNDEWTRKYTVRFYYQWMVARRLDWVGADDKPSELFDDPETLLED